MLPDKQQRIMGYFIEEAKDHLNTIEQGLMNLQNTIQDPEMVNEVYRAAHSIKGGAGMLGLESIQKTSDRLEDCFQILKDRPLKVDSKLEALFLQVFTTLEELLKQLETPCGLTEENSNAIMASAQPIFTELNNHVKQLLNGASDSPAPANKSVPPTFQQDVLVQLREMLQLFKQADTAEHRQQLQAICGNLAQIGQQSALGSWSSLVEACSRAIANPENSYRTLATVVIKEIKQAQELILSAKINQISQSEQLKLLLPIEEQQAEPLLLETEFAVASLTQTEATTRAKEVASLNVGVSTNEQYFAPQQASPMFAETDYREPSRQSRQQQRAEDLVSAKFTGHHKEAEVGMAELNSLADLFESEAPALDESWQEEEIVANANNSSLLNKDSNQEKTDVHQLIASNDEHDDFSDLLGDMGDLKTLVSVSPTESEDLIDLFGDDFLEDSSSDDDGISNLLAIETEGNAIEDSWLVEDDTEQLIANNEDDILDFLVDTDENEFAVNGDNSSSDQLEDLTDFLEVREETQAGISLETDDLLDLLDDRDDDFSLDSPANTTQVAEFITAKGDDFDGIGNEDEDFSDLLAISKDEKEPDNVLEDIDIDDLSAGDWLDETSAEGFLIDEFLLEESQQEIFDNETYLVSSTNIDISSLELESENHTDDLALLSSEQDLMFGDFESTSAQNSTDQLFDTVNWDDPNESFLDEVYSVESELESAAPLSLGEVGEADIDSEQAWDFDSSFDDILEEPVAVTENQAENLESPTLLADEGELNFDLEASSFSEELSSDGNLNGLFDDEISNSIVTELLEANQEESLDDLGDLWQPESAIAETSDTLENWDNLELTESPTSADLDIADENLFETEMAFDWELEEASSTNTDLQLDLASLELENSVEELFGVEGSTEIDNLDIEQEQLTPQIANQEDWNFDELTQLDVQEPVLADAAQNLEDLFDSDMAAETVNLDFEQEHTLTDDLEISDELNNDFDGWVTEETTPVTQLDTTDGLGDLEELTFEEEAPVTQLDTTDEWSDLGDLNDLSFEEATPAAQLDTTDGLGSLDDLSFEEVTPVTQLDATEEWGDLGDLNDLSFEETTPVTQLDTTEEWSDLGDLDDLSFEEATPVTQLDTTEEWSDLGDLNDLSFEEATPVAQLDTTEEWGDIGDLDDLSFEEATPVTQLDTTDELGDLDDLLFEEATPVAQLDDSNDFADLDGLLSDQETPTANLIDLNGADDFADLDGLLSDRAIVTSAEENSTALSDLDELEALLSSTSPANQEPAKTTQVGEAIVLDDDFAEMEKLLLNAEHGGQQTAKPATKPGRAKQDQIMRVPVKYLDNFSNLLGELVVNRNSLEQDQERMRQFLDNLLNQVQQLSDVGARMQDLYERSLLESSLLASRQQANRFSGAGRNEQPQENQHNNTGVRWEREEMDLFTPFHTLSQEMIEMIVRVRESASDIEFLVDETDQVARMLRQVTTQLQEGLTRARMVPFEEIERIFPIQRAVKMGAAEYGKQAEVLIEGRKTMIDKVILENLSDPLKHLVNNAIAHGLETPDVRIAAGKPPVGRITIRAFHQGNQTVITFSDDGAGIDVARVKVKAIEKKLITPEQAKSMTAQDVYELLYHPGFSTKDTADLRAGKGVGMDVVRTNVIDIRGTITTDSSQGKGTTFTVRLPLTLSIGKALCCLSDRTRIAFPMDGVEDMLDVSKDRINTNSEGKPCIAWRDTILPFQPLSELLSYNRQIGRGTVYGGNREDDMISIVILRSTGNFLAIEVDQVLGEQEIVIKQLEGPVPKPVGIAGATVLGDGRIMPIADVLELIDISVGRIRKDSGGSLWDNGQKPQEVAVKADPMVLIIDDSITVRELLSMTFNKAGYRVEQARDGQEAWDKLRSGLPCNMIFCDVEMPRMNGLDLLERIKKDENLCHLPVAMLTSRTATKHQQLAAQLGASGYFTKPYLEEVLLDAAQRMMKGEKLLAASAG